MVVLRLAFQVMSVGGVGVDSLARVELDAMIAFTRVYGYVRYFHPADEASAINWERFAIHGARRMLTATTESDIARLLHELFAPVAPTVTFSSAALPPPPGSTGDSDYLTWQHLGYGLGDNREGGYRSVRARFGPGAAGDSISRLFPRHQPRGSTLTVQLGPSLFVRVPLALDVTPTGTRGSAPNAPAFRELVGTVDALDSTARSTSSRAARLADVVVTWNVLQHFYPYHREAGIDFADKVGPALAAAAAARDAPSQTLAIRDLVQNFEDGHSTVTHPVMRAVARNGWLPIAVHRSGEHVVVTATRDSIIRRGDRIVTVNGIPALRLLADAERALLGTARRRVHVARIAGAFVGERDSVAHLRITRRGADLEVRARYVADSAGGPLLTEEFSLGDIVEIEPGVIYVDMVRLTEQLLASRLDQLGRAAVLILDFRHYTAMVPSILSHLARTPLQSVVFRTPEIIAPDRDAANGLSDAPDFSILPAAPRLSARVIALTSGSALSRAETYLSILKHHRLATVVGEASAGANGGLNWFHTPTGFFVSFTGDHVTHPDGSQLQRTGVIPHIKVRRTAAGVAAGRDELLDAALMLARRMPRTTSRGVP